MDFETMVQILVAAQALVRLAMTVEQRRRIRAGAAAGAAPVAQATAGKEVRG
jgi:hypothetical protein